MNTVVHSNECELLLILLFIFFFLILFYHLLWQTQAFHLCSPGFGKPHSNVFAPFPGVLAKVLNPASWDSDSKSMFPCLFTFTFQPLGHPHNPLSVFSSAPDSIGWSILAGLLGACSLFSIIRPSMSPSWLCWDLTVTGLPARRNSWGISRR